MHEASDTNGGLERLLAPVALIVLGLILHWPGGAGLKADDYPVVAYASDWGRVLDDWFGPQYDLRFFLFYRPVITTSLAVDHALFGIEPFGFLLMNALACIGAALLLRAIAAQMGPGRGRLFGFLLAVLWLLQPILVPSLRWVVGRVDTHVALAMLASVWFFLRARKGGSMQAAWVLAVVAFLTKEAALGLPLVILGLDLLHPEPAERGPVIFGRSVPSLPFLLLIPAVFLLRLLVIGEPIGGYYYSEGLGVEVFRRTEGLWATLTHGFAPIPLGVLRIGIALVPIGFVCFWLAVPRDGRGWRIAGLLCASAGLWGPLAPVLLRMVLVEQQRYAYLACVWMLIAWLGFAFTVGRRSAPLVVGIGLAPVLWILPAWFEAHDTMQRHDVFNTQTLAALEEGDRATADPAAPLILDDRSGEAHDVFRLLWGLGVIMKPPFREGNREVVSLRPTMPWVGEVDRAFFGNGVAGSVDVHEYGGEWVAERNPVPAIPVGPLEFDGTMTVEHLERLAAAVATGRVEEEIPFGYDAGAGFDGRVAMVTSVGSFEVSVAAVDGRLRLTDLLMANTDPAAGPGEGGVMAVGLLWIAFDLASGSPVYLYWHARDGLRRAELLPGPGLADAIWRILKELG